MSGWAPSSDIFNLLDRWTDEGFRLLGGEVGLGSWELCFPFMALWLKCPPPPLHLSKIQTSSFIYPDSQDFSPFLVFHAWLPFPLWGIFDFCSRPQDMFSAPCPCRSRKGWLGSDPGFFAPLEKGVFCQRLLFSSKLSKFSCNPLTPQLVGIEFETLGAQIWASYSFGK